MQLTPERRRAMIESYGAAYDELVAALDTFPREMWQFKPAPHEWSVHEQIVHLADSEANSYVRVRHGIAEPTSRVAGYDQDVWAVALAYHDQSTEDALELFKWLRRMSYNLIRTLPDEIWTNTIEHPENGTMSLDDWLVIYEAHVRGHITQMQGVYEAWRRTC
jgi:hypothetical protein